MHGFNHVIGDGPGRGRSVRWGRKKLRQTGPGPGLHGGLADIAGSGPVTSRPCSRELITPPATRRIHWSPSLQAKQPRKHIPLYNTLLLRVAIGIDDARP